MKEKVLKTSIFTIFVACILLLGAAFAGLKTAANAEQGKVTSQFAIAELPTGVPEMVTVAGVKQGTTADSEFKKQQIQMVTAGGESVPAFYVDKLHLVMALNCVTLAEPIENISALTDIRIRIYAHLSSHTTYRVADTSVRGVRLFALDSTGEDKGILIPANVKQDQWIDLSLTFSEFSALCDKDGVFRGLKFGSWIRGTSADTEIYQDGSAFLAVKEISYSVDSREQNIEIADFPEGVDKMTKVSGVGAGQMGDSKLIYEAIQQKTVSGISGGSISVHHKNAIVSSNAILLKQPVDDAVNSIKEVKIRIYAHLWSGAYWANNTNRGLRLFSLDSDGSDKGVLIPRTVVQDRWVDLTLSKGELSALCDADGALRGIKIGSLIRSEMLYPDGAAYIVVGDVIVDEKLAQKPLVLEKIGDVKYGDTAALSFTGGSGTGALSFEILSGTAQFESNRLTFTALGEVKLQVKKAFDDDFKAAESNIITVNVEKFTDNRISWIAEPKDMPYTGDVVSVQAEALRGDVALEFFAWDFEKNSWTPSGTADAPSQRGRYKVVAKVDGNEFYEGNVLEKEFYITAAVTLENATYTGSTRAGETIAFSATPPIGMQVDDFEVKVGDGEFVRLDGNTYKMGTEDIVVRALFKKITYKVTAEEGVSYTGTPEYQQTITVSAATPPVGKTVGYFTVNGEKIAGNTFVMPAQDVVLGVVYKNATYKITAESGITYTGTPQFGETITLDAGTAPEGKALEYFTVNGEKIEGNTFTMPAGDVQISAVWKNAETKKSGCNSVVTLYAGGGLFVLAVSAVLFWLAFSKKRAK